MDATAILNGDRRALARLLSGIENGRREAHQVLAALYGHTGRAHVVGITGPPGTGKSSLVAALARTVRASGRTVAILAVDPSSPFSGGAILGDRIRMRALHGDSGVFIRSMASRGALGGLAPTTSDVARALDAAGFDLILIETVGAGQSEIEIARAAQTTIVVEAPGLGDDIQAIKAGILEIADILVVNKADLQGVEGAVRALRAALELEAAAGGQPREVPVLTTVATTGQGLEALLTALDEHRRHLADSGQGVGRERVRLARELESRVRQALWQALTRSLKDGQLAMVADKLVAREIDPDSAVRDLLAQFSASLKEPS
jgi:LAO/AO transport system kinase